MTAPKTRSIITTPWLRAVLARELYVLSRNKHIAWGRIDDMKAEATHMMAIIQAVLNEKETAEIDACVAPRDLI